METISSSEVTLTPTITIGINEFASRHTMNSPYSFYNGSNDSLIDLITAAWDNKQVGELEGTFIVPVPPEGFFTGIVEVDENTELTAIYSTRTNAIEAETPSISVFANGRKIPAKTAQAIIYSRTILASQNMNTTDADYEVISIEASPTVEAEPMSPMTMARNYLNMPGGTKTKYTAEQFAKAIWFWATHAHSIPTTTDSE